MELREYVRMLRRNLLLITLSSAVGLVSGLAYALLVHQTPTAPTDNAFARNAVLGLFVGLALGAAAAVIRTSLDTRIRNERDLEHLTDLPIIGGIAFEPRAKVGMLAIRADPQSQCAESFRTLRTNLQFLVTNPPHHGFVVTSPTRGEGKSSVVANLAIALSDTGRRVLVIDADLRTPRVAEYLDVEAEVGLTDVLGGRAELDAAIQRCGETELYVLPSGRIPADPSGLLSSEAMANLAQELGASFEVVLCDTPSILPASDAAALARAMGAALVVVAAGRTRATELTDALVALEDVGVKVSGLVVNTLPTKGPYASERYKYTYNDSM